LEAFYRTQDFENARHELLKYYYSEIMTHGTYILSLFIGLFTAVEALPRINFPVEFVRQVFASIVLGALFACLLYSVGRMLVYAKMVGWVFDIRPMSYEKVIGELDKSPNLRPYVTVTPLYMLQKNVDAAVRENSKHWMGLFSSKYQIRLLLASICFLSVFFLFLQYCGWINFRGSLQ
jgi:hypothetical protein